MSVAEISPKHYLGPLCLRGHAYRDTGKSLRYLSAKTCVECAKEFQRRPEYREKVAKWRRDTGYESSPKRKAYKRQLSYNLSEDEYQALLKKQDNCCAVCGVEFDGSGRSKTAPVVDHCHATKVVRGILCGRCNKAEGWLSKTPKEVLRRLLEYAGRADN